MSSLWDMSLRDAIKKAFKSLHPKELPSATSRAVNAYRAKYITSRSAGIRPAVHIMAAVVLLSYATEFRHLRKHEALRKYH